MLNYGTREGNIMGEILDEFCKLVTEGLTATNICDYVEKKTIHKYSKKRFKKLLMAKGFGRNISARYADTEYRTQEFLDGCYIISVDHFFAIDKNWIDHVTEPSHIDKIINEELKDEIQD